MSDEEREKMYGMEIGEIKDSPGLGVDISFITSFHTRFVLEAIARRLPERPKYMVPINENYVVWGNRPVHPFKRHFELQRIELSRQQQCAVCAGGSSEEMFKSRQPPVSVSIARAALDLIYDECDRYNVDETGGRLIGTYQRKGAHFEVSVSAVIGPGPNAQRSSTSFFQDGEYQEKVFREIESRHPAIEHLGNWHTHHVNGYPTPEQRRHQYLPQHRQSPATQHRFFLCLTGRAEEPRRKSSRYDVRHFFLRRGDDKVHGISETDIHIVDAPLLWPATAPAAGLGNAGVTYTPSGGSSANPERAKDQEFFAEFYPELKSLFSAKLGAPYWKGPVRLVDGSVIDIVAVESADGLVPEYSIVTSPSNKICVTTLWRHTKGASSRRPVHAVLRYFERVLNQALYRGR